MIVRKKSEIISVKGASIRTGKNRGLRSYRSGHLLGTVTTVTGSLQRFSSRGSGSTQYSNPYPEIHGAARTLFLLAATAALLLRTDPYVTRMNIQSRCARVPPSHSAYHVRLSLLSLFLPPSIIPPSLSTTSWWMATVGDATTTTLASFLREREKERQRERQRDRKCTDNVERQ